MTLKSTFKLALLSLLLNSSGVLAADNLGANAQESGEVEGLAFLAQSDMEGPVTLVDFVKFKPGGEETYERYDALAEEKLSASGITPIISNQKIDRMILVAYPSHEAFLSMLRSDAYRTISSKRTNSIELGLNFPFSDRK